MKRVSSPLMGGHGLCAVAVAVAMEGVLLLWWAVSMKGVLQLVCSSTATNGLVPGYALRLGLGSILCLGVFLLGLRPTPGLCPMRISHLGWLAGRGGARA